MAQSRAAAHRDDLLFRVRQAIAAQEPADAADEAVRLAKFVHAMQNQKRALQRRNRQRRRGVDGVE